MLMLIVNSMARLTCFICDPLSKTWHIPDFMKIEIRPEIDISMFSCAAVKKMEVIGCLVPKLRRKTHRGRRMQVFEKNTIFLHCYGKL